MAEFKVGDRLRGKATGVWGRDDGPGVEGVFRGEYRRLFDVDGWPLVRKDGGGNYAYLDPREPITVVSSEPSKLAFVGPEPEPAEVPTVTTPFQVSSRDCFKRVLRDSGGREIADFTGDTTTSEEDEELAALVVKLLNAHFGVGQ